MLHKEKLEQNLEACIKGFNKKFYHYLKMADNTSIHVGTIDEKLNNVQNINLGCSLNYEVYMM